jgi:hypothetical protein
MMAVTTQDCRNRSVEMARMAKELRSIAFDKRVPAERRYKAAVLADHFLELGEQFEKLIVEASKR